MYLKIIQGILEGAAKGLESEKKETLELKDQFDYVMEHFQFIAEQRLKTFHFYSILLAASVGATIAVVQRPFTVQTYLIAAAFHLLIPTLFFVIERRNLRLLNIARDGLQFLEGDDAVPTGIRLSLKDKDSNKGWRSLVSYKLAFTLTYACQFIFGFGIAICASAKHIPTPPPPEVRSITLSDGTTVRYLANERRRSRHKSSAVKSIAERKNPSRYASEDNPPTERASSREASSATAVNTGMFIP